MIQVHHTPKFVRRLYPSLTWKKSSKDTLFLTFDDGPHPEITPWVLEKLDKFDAKATFFCVGENIDKYPDIAKKTNKKGHLLSNHTYHHLKGWKVNKTHYLEDVSACQNSINKIIPNKKMLFRPPYGRIKRNQIQALALDYEIIMWSHLSWDFDPSLNIKQAFRSMKKVSPGSIVVFHDSEKANKNLRDLLPELLDYWTEKGFKLEAL